MIDNGLYVDDVTTRHSSLTASVPAVGTASQVAQASAKRKRITFISSGPNIMQIQPDNPVNANRFIQISAQAPILVLDYDDYGSLIQGPWFAQSLVAPMGLAVIDTVEQ